MLYSVCRCVERNHGRYGCKAEDIEPGEGSLRYSDINATTEIEEKHKEKLNKILSENTGKDLEIITSDTERDNFFTAEEAKDYGLIDKVITSKGE